MWAEAAVPFIIRKMRVFHAGVESLESELVGDAVPMALSADDVLEGGALCDRMRSELISGGEYGSAYGESIRIQRCEIDL